MIDAEVQEFYPEQPPIHERAGGEPSKRKTKAFRAKEGYEYWIVVGMNRAPQSGAVSATFKAPFRHSSFGSACKEAERLAQEFPGQLFNVFKLKMSYIGRKDADAVGP